MAIDEFLLSGDTTDLNYPEIRPTLDLNFARTKTLDPRITFRRASGGSYFGPDGRLRYAGVNEPRFDHNPTTGESLGLLVEESRTNLLLRSEEFDDASWNLTNILAFGSGSTVNSTASPDGLVTADKVTEDLATGFHRIGQLFSHVAGTTYTFTVFVKAAERTKIHLQLSASLFRIALFDLTTGATSSSNANIVNYGNGWYRCSLTSTATTTSTATAFVEITDDSNNRQYTGDGTSGIYIWGAQLEAEAFPTSYIKTEASAATRAADVASITGSAFSSWYRQDAGTVFADVARGSAVTGQYPNIVNFTDGTGSNKMQVYGLDYGDRYTHEIVSAGSAQVAFSQSQVLAANTFNKLSLAFKANDTAFVANTSLILADSLVTLPTVNQAIFSGTAIRTIRRITYWPQRLPNTTLESITA